MGHNDIFVSFSGTLMGFMKGDFKESDMDNAWFFFSCTKDYFYGPEDKIKELAEPHFFRAEDDLELAKKLFPVLKAKVAASDKKGKVAFREWDAVLQKLFDSEMLKQLLWKKDVMALLGFNLHKRF